MDDWVELEQFGKAKLKWFRTFLELPNGIPSHDTFGRVFRMLDPEAFGRCFSSWVASIAELSLGEVVAIDGKTVRRSLDGTLGKSAIHGRRRANLSAFSASAPPRREGTHAGDGALAFVSASSG